MKHGKVILGIGCAAAAATVALQIWEVAVTPRAVRRWNRKHRKRKQPRSAVLPAPLISRDPTTGANVYGLAAVGWF